MMGQLVTDFYLTLASTLGISLTELVALICTAGLYVAYRSVREYIKLRKQLASLREQEAVRAARAPVEVNLID